MASAAAVARRILDMAWQCDARNNKWPSAFFLGRNGTRALFIETVNKESQRRIPNGLFCHGHISIIINPRVSPRGSVLCFGWLSHSRQGNLPTQPAWSTPRPPRCPTPTYWTAPPRTPIETAVGGRLRSRSTPMAALDPPPRKITRLSAGAGGRGSSQHPYL